VASIYGKRMGLPEETVLVIAADRETVLWNSSQVRKIVFFGAVL